MALAAHTQTTKPKPTKSATTTKKPTAASKPKQAQTTSAEPKPTPIPKKAPDENESYEKAVAITDTGERVTALRKFLRDFPKTEKRTGVLGMLVTIQLELANEKTKANDAEAAAKLFLAAAGDAPQPLSEPLFANFTGKILPALFWAGQRVAAFDLAKTLEAKSSTSVPQLLDIANFYMGIENGSEARRVTGDAIKLDPNSAVAYQTLGLANRIDFLLEDSVAAYSKALELDPASISARRGLAEMKRSLGRSDEAAALYTEILAKEADNLPARTGLILAMFEGGKRAEAEAELTRALEAAPGNVMLLSGVAYWYAAHNEGTKAIEFAQRAIASDPRFIWSHIALARGLMAERRPIDAEKTLLAARRYGNFPTLEYEIASARVKSGFFREAAEELGKNFSIKEGVVSTKLGGRLTRESADLTSLIERERQASIFAPIAADTPENAAILKSLLELTVRLNEKEAKVESVVNAADAFTSGTDDMRVHRLLFASRELLSHKIAAEKAAELATAAVGKDDIGLDVPSPVAAILADELYDSRRLAASRDEYIRVPDVPRQTLSAILRGRIEEMNGWALYQTDKWPESAIRLKRAVSVLPTDSAWWRSSMWRLGASLEADGKDAEALETYIRAYKAGQVDAVKYSIVEAAYKRVNGNSEGLKAKIGANPLQPAPETVAAKTDPTPEPKSDPTPEPTVAPSPTPEATPSTSPSPEAPKTEPTPETTPAVVKIEPTPETTPAVVKTEPTPETTPAVIKVEPTPETTPEIKVEPSPTPTPETTPEPKSEASPTPTPVQTETAPTPTPTPETETKPTPAIPQPTPTPTPAGKDLFPPVIIIIPPPTTIAKVEKTESKTVPVTEQPSETPPTEVRPRVIEAKPDESAAPCKLTLSEESITLDKNGGDLAVIVGSDEDIDLTAVKAVFDGTQDLSVRREPITGIKGRALFVFRSTSSRTGLYSVVFDMPCGTKTLRVTVR